MQGDDPPFLPVGTDVSAKYKGAFCEAKIKKVVRNIKCKVTLKAGGTVTVNDDVIKGTLRVGSNVEVKQDPKKEAMEAIITKIQDCSQYTVVFDDGDITTLRRSALCLKSGRHFNESETLDQLPLTHPEHFSTPVIAGRRGRRGRAQSDESEGEGTSSRPVKADSAEREPHVGRVVLVEAASGAERRRPHQPAFPALVVAPTAQIKVKEDYLVRSFKDGRYYTVPKKEAREFRKGSAPLEWAGVEAALQYLNNGVLPPHWDRDALFNEPRNTSDDSSDDEPREEKDHFVAQLYKFMDDRGTPLNRNPTIANRDIDLYRLFRVVQKLGGYNRVTNQNQWKTIADKMGFHPVTTSITNLCKQAYKKFLHSFEDFYRKLGVTLVAHPRGARTPPAGRSLIRDKDRLPPTSSSASSTPNSTPTQRGKDKDSDKSETEKSDKSEKEEKEKIEKVEVKPKEKPPRASDGEDSADNQPLAVTTPKVEKEKEKEKDKEREKSTSTTTSEEKIPVKPRSQSKGRTVTPVKSETHEKRIAKRRPLSSKSESATTSTPRASRRPHASTDSDSSGRASRCGPTKKMQSRRSQSANSASSGNTIASNSSKRTRKRKNTEPSGSEPTRSSGANVKAQVGDKLEVYYGPTQSESKVTYEAKVIEISAEGMLRVHYTGWNTRYDEWIKPQRIALNVTQHEARNKKNTSISRRVRAKRTEESSARSDSDSDTDSDDLVKRPPQKSDEKSSSKTPSRTKDNKSSDSSSSSKPRKRPIRNVSTPTSVSPVKKPRSSISGHQGRDYDLNEIRSELKGLHRVKQEPDETSIKQDAADIDSNTISNPQVTQVPPEPAQSEKQPEDVYEFKEPEPFELELHDEKKKRTHRIFDDISPSKYTSALSKSLSEEISEDPLRARPSLHSPSLSPFRDFVTVRETGRQSPEEDSKDGMFSLDDDSFPGDGSSGPMFEGFTPAKNQETYSKKSKVSKIRNLINDSPDSPADDEQSSEDESENVIVKQEEKEVILKTVAESVEIPKSPEPENKETPKEQIEEPVTTVDKEKIEDEKIGNFQESKEEVSTAQDIPKTPSPQMKIETTIQKTEEISPQNKLEVPTQNKVEVSVQKKVEVPTQKKIEGTTPKKAEVPIPKKVDVQTPKKIEIPTHKKIEVPPQKKIETPQKKVELPAQKKNDAVTQKKVEISAQKKMEPPSQKKIEPTSQKKPEIMTQKKVDIYTQKKVEVLTPKNTEITTQKKIEITLQKKIEVPTPKKVELPRVMSPAAAVSTTSIKEVYSEAKEKEEIKKEDLPKPSTVPLPPPEVKENTLKLKIDKMDPEPVISKLEPPSSPLIDTEEDKSEPDSPARIDVIPEPPPGFLLQSEGPKIAEKLLKAISSAKRLSMSPPPAEDRTSTLKSDALKPNRPESKLASVSPEPRVLPAKPELIKPIIKIDPVKKMSPSEFVDSIFGEPSNLTDAKRDSLDIRKVKPCEATPPRLQSPLNILERRKSVCELPLVPGKNNKVLSDTIQKLSSQINQAAAAVATVTPIPAVPSVTLTAFPSEDRSESSDSDDSDRRLIIDKLSAEEWGSGGSSEASRALAASVAATLPISARSIHAGKSPGEWSAGESLLMLEDACKNERKHSASVVVAGTGRVPSVVSATGLAAMSVASAVAAGEEDSNLSLLLCEETIPGSPAPDAEPAPPRQRLHMPFASAPPHHNTHSKGDDRRGEGGSRHSGPTNAGNGSGGAGEGPAGGQPEPGAASGGWGRRQPMADNTPPTTPDSSLDMSPHRDRRMSERDSPSERKEDDDEGRNHDVSGLDMDKPSAGLRSRKASESSCAGRGRTRRSRRDTDEHSTSHHLHNSSTTLKYNFYVELDPTWDCQTRINVLTSRLADLRKAYHSVKAELAAIDRRRKKLRRKEREAVKAAKAACS